MCKFSKFIISLILVLSMNLSIFVFADDYTSSNYNLVDIYTSRLATLGDGVTGGVLENFLGLAINRVSSESSAAFGDGSVCADSPDNLHHSSNYQPSLGGGSDARGYYTFFQCDYCGQMFKCYSDDFSNAYDDHVAEMPATNWSSSGSFIVTATHSSSYFQKSVASGSNRYYYYLPCPHSTMEETLSASEIDSYVHACSGTLSFAANGGYSFGFSLYCLYTLSCPVAGYYKRISSPQYSYTTTNSSGTVYKYNYSWQAQTSTTYYSAGANINSQFSCTVGSAVSVGSVYPPKYAVTPSAADTTTTNYYTNASRPTYNITYDLATVNNYGDYTVINNVYENQTIINEGDNIYTDIKTGNEYEIEGWEFDYTTRTYHLTLDNGDLVDVTFGDKYVTVELNGEVEYYYYATEDDSAAGCSHDYDLAESVAATCTKDGYNVYVCTLCNHSYQDQTFAIGHNYQFLWTVLDTYEVDTSTLVCPGCNGTDITCTQVDKTENFTCVCNSADCAQTWTVVGSTIAGYDLYQCINCQEFYNDYTHEGVDRSDAGYWSWLQTWLQNFKTWLGEKLDALINKEVAVSGGDTINNEEVNNFYDQSDTTINTDESIDYNITYTDGDGVEQETSLRSIIAKFAFIKDIWKIGQTLIAVVSEDAAYAYEFDPALGDASANSGDAAVAASLEEEADVLLDGSSGAPSFPINLGAANSVYGFNYGGEVEMLELDWYTPYKETVDKLVGGFLWLFFMWKLFMKAPGIISGASMDSSKAEDVKSGTKGKRR